MLIGPEYVGDTELPWNPGMHRGANADDDLEEAKRKGRWTLTGMASSYRFYSADILQYSGAIVHPVDLFWAENNLPMDETPFLLELDRVILDGLPAPLSHSVYACPNMHAAKLFAFLDRIAVGDPPNITWQSVHQRLQLVDWQLVKSLSIVPNQPPTVPVELYGLSGQTMSYLWKPPFNPWKEPICLKEIPHNRQNQRDPKRSKRRPFSR